MRVGVHTGEVEIVGEGIGGIAVHIGARVASLEIAGEVLVTRTVKDLTAGSGIEFQERQRMRCAASRATGSCSPPRRWKRLGEPGED